MMFFIDKKYMIHSPALVVLVTHQLIKCDTFSRSADAVFELSMRFAEPFKIAEGLSAEEKLEAERLMFLELTQGKILPASSHNVADSF